MTSLGCRPYPWIVATVHATVEGAGSLPEIRQLQIYVPYTGDDSAVVAIHTAHVWARELDAAISLLVVRVVPYPLDIDKPDVEVAALTRYIKTIVLRTPARPKIVVCHARDPRDAWGHVLPPHSLVVIGCDGNLRQRIRGNRLAVYLQKAGHDVTSVSANTCTTSSANSPRIPVLSCFSLHATHRH